MRQYLLYHTSNESNINLSPACNSYVESLLITILFGTGDVIKSKNKYEIKRR